MIKLRVDSTLGVHKLHYMLMLGRGRAVVQLVTNRIGRFRPEPQQRQLPGGKRRSRGKQRPSPPPLNLLNVRPVT